MHCEHVPVMVGACDTCPELRGICLLLVIERVYKATALSEVHRIFFLFHQSGFWSSVSV